MGLIVQNIQVEEVEDFADFLIREKELSIKQASNILYYLQEKLHIVPSNFEVCTICGVVFDIDYEGNVDEKKGPLCGYCY